MGHVRVQRAGVHNNGQSAWRCLGGRLEASRENLLALIAGDYWRPALPKEIKTPHLDQVN
jgi:hypothetical protein